MQLLGQGALVELGAGRDGALDDQLAQAGADLEMEHPRRDGKNLGHGLFCMQKARRNGGWV